MSNTHPKQPYQHNMTKICKVEGCYNLGYIIKCNYCGQMKRKTMCEKHLLEHKEMNRLYRGKLSNAYNLKHINYLSNKDNV